MAFTAHNVVVVAAAKLGRMDWWPYPTPMQGSYKPCVVTWWKKSKTTFQSFIPRRTLVYSMEDVNTIAERDDFLDRTENQRKFWKRQVEFAERHFAKQNIDLSWLEDDDEHP